MPSVEQSPIDHQALLFERLMALRRGAPECAILFSSRLGGYGAFSVLGAAEWRLLPFSRPQLRVAAQKWLSARPEAVDTFIRTMTHTPPLAEILVNPMLLMLACRVWESALERGEAPPTLRNRSDLYGQFASSFRERWVERMALRGRAPTLSQQEAFLPFVENLAWELWRGNPSRSVFRGSEIMEVIERIPKPRLLESRPDLFDDVCESGVLTKSGPRSLDAPYLFLHRTLLEFFAARYVATKLDPVKEAQPYIGKPEAHVLLWMLVGSLKDPAPLIKAILPWAEAQLELPRESSPTAQSPVLAELLIDCLFECREGTLDGNTRGRCWELITRGLDRKQRSRRKQGGEWAALVDWSLVYRAMRAVRIHEGPLSRAEEVLTLIEQIHHGQAPRTNGVGTEDASSAERTLRVGLRSGCSVVRWGALWTAMALLRKGKNGIRSGVGSLVADLLRLDSSDHVRCLAARALAELGEPNSLTVLRAILDGTSPYAAVGAAIGLGRLVGAEGIAILRHKADLLLGAEVSNTRDPLLVAVVGAMEAVVDKAADSDEGGDPGSLLQDGALADIFLRALAHLLPLVTGTAASALGKMRWKAAWDRLKALAEVPDESAPDLLRRRASALFACDQLADVLDSAQLIEAEALFRGVLNNRREAPSVRRPAASGITRLLKRGYRSVDVVNDLLQAAQDPDVMVARSALVGLIQLAPEEIIQDMTLLLQIFSQPQRQLLCVAARSHPTKTAILLFQWLLNRDSDPDVLASALSAVSEAYRKAREWHAAELMQDLCEGQLLGDLAQRALALSFHQAPHVVASSLSVFQELARLRPFHAVKRLESTRGEMIRRAQALLAHEEPGVQASACGMLGVAGGAEDLEALEALKERSPSGKVRRSAKGAYELLKRRLSPAYSVGQRFDGTVFRISPRRDFVLVKLSEEFTSILHLVNMSRDFKGKLERGEIGVGMTIAVEIVEVDAVSKRVSLRDV